MSLYIGPLFEKSEPLVNPEKNLFTDWRSISNRPNQTKRSALPSLCQETREAHWPPEIPACSLSSFTSSVFATIENTNAMAAKPSLDSNLYQMHNQSCTAFHDASRPQLLLLSLPCKMCRTNIHMMSRGLNYSRRTNLFPIRLYTWLCSQTSSHGWRKIPFELWYLPEIPFRMWLVRVAQKKPSDFDAMNWIPLKGKNKLPLRKNISQMDQVARPMPSRYRRTPARHSPLPHSMRLPETWESLSPPKICYLFVEKTWKNDQGMSAWPTKLSYYPQKILNNRKETVWIPRIEIDVPVRKTTQPYQPYHRARPLGSPAKNGQSMSKWTSNGEKSWRAGTSYENTQIVNSSPSLPRPFIALFVYHLRPMLSFKFLLQNRTTHQMFFPLVKRMPCSGEAYDSHQVRHTIPNHRKKIEWTIL
jgi:hypothetical protein